MGRILSRCGFCLLTLAWHLGDALGGTISGSFTPIPTGANVDLTLAGKTDWVHWGLFTDTSVNRKFGVPAQISDFSLVANPLTTVLAYQYSDNYSGYTWYDGWPITNVTNTTAGVWAYQAFPLNPASTGFGFQITVPADTTTRTLQLYVGTYDAQGQLKATLSDGGLPYTDTSLSNTGNGPGGVYSLSYRANSPNQTLTVQWTLYQRAAGSNSPQANVTLQAAALSSANANNPPLASLSAPPDQSSFSTPATINLDANAQDFDGIVTNVAFYAGTTLLGQRTASPYTNSWNNAPVGHYYLTAVATDNGGAARSSVPVEVFVYGSGGSLTGSVANPPASVDLTGEGTADWIHWGLLTNTSVDRKSGVVAQISNLAVLGTNALQRYADNYTGFSWSDGSPNASANNSTTGIFITGLTNGFSLTAPADATLRTLRVYVGCYGAQGAFEAYLDDLSAAPYFDDSTSSQYGNDYAVYELNYTAVSAGRKLNIVYHTLNLLDFDYGNVTIQAATLAGGSSLPAPVYLLNPRMLGADFVMSFQTQAGHTYTVMHADSLPAGSWGTLTNLAGTGGLVTVTNVQPTSTQRYYRVVAQ